MLHAMDDDGGLPDSCGAAGVCGQCPVAVSQRRHSRREKRKDSKGKGQPEK